MFQRNVLPHLLGETISCASKHSKSSVEKHELTVTLILVGGCFSSQERDGRMEHEGLMGGAGRP
jgi:hypothetical protein